MLLLTADDTMGDESGRWTIRAVPRLLEVVSRSHSRRFLASLAFLWLENRCRCRAEPPGRLLPAVLSHSLRGSEVAVNEERPELLVLGREEGRHLARPSRTCFTPTTLCMASAALAVNTGRCVSQPSQKFSFCTGLFILRACLRAAV